ncbi:MAG TPA: hypothetical protein VGL09_11775, partial [Methylomirabilota bacterium]
ALPPADLETVRDALVGLETDDGELLGLGVVTAVEPSTLTVLTPADATRAAAVVVGRERYAGN